MPGAHTTRSQHYVFNHILSNSVSCACQALTRRGTSVTFSTISYRILCRVRARRSHDAELALRFQPCPSEFCVVCVPGAHTTRSQRYVFNHILPNSVSCACQALTRRGTSVTFSTMSYRVLCRVRARRSHDAATKNRVRNRLYTDPFIMAPGWFESPAPQLSNHPGIIKNGSVYSRLRTRFWSQRNWIVLPPRGPLHYLQLCASPW